MRSREFLSETHPKRGSLYKPTRESLVGLYEEDFAHFSSVELSAMKSVIASKIKKLPDDDATAKTLKEIEELLQHVNAGGRMGMIRGQLEQINDPAVLASQKQLAQYLASMEVDPKDRAELFSLWRSNQLVDVEKLLSKKSYSFSEIFNRYGENKAVTDLVDDVMSVSNLGQGKGEFGLNVLSKSVVKPGTFVPKDLDKEQDISNPDSLRSSDDQQAENKLKGDLLIKHNGKWIKIEVKTTHGGGARFGDQEVRPAVGYEQAASTLSNFVEQLKGTTAYQTIFPKGVAKDSGLNIRDAINLYSSFLKQDKLGPQFLKLVEDVITLIFGGKTADKQQVSAIMKAFRDGNANQAVQQYSQASFNYYMSKKDDEGVLAIDLNSKTTMFYSDASDLTKEKLRLHSRTIYLTAKDAVRGAYPQLMIQPTTFGADAKAAAEKRTQQQAITTAKANPVQVPDITSVEDKKVDPMVYNYVTNKATSKGVFDQDVIDHAAVQTMDMLVQGVPRDQIAKQIIAILNQSKPQPTARTVPVPQTTPTPTAPAAPTTPQTMGRAPR